MSKKIVIPSINLRKDLGNLFKSFISRVGYYHNTCYNYGYGYVTYDDYDYPYEDYEAYQEWKNELDRRSKGKKGHQEPPRKGEYDFSNFWDAEEENKKKKKSKHRNRHGKKGRIIDINTPYSGEEDCMNDECDYTERVIYFYPDYHDRESRLEFTSYDKFKEFCESMNYKITDIVDTWIRYNTVCHCCLSREALLDDVYEIVAEESYGVLFYEVCEADEL